MARMGTWTAIILMSEALFCKGNAIKQWVCRFHMLVWPYRICNAFAIDMIQINGVSKRSRTSALSDPFMPNLSRPNVRWMMCIANQPTKSDGFSERFLLFNIVSESCWIPETRCFLFRCSADVSLVSVNYYWMQMHNCVLPVSSATEVPKSVFLSWSFHYLSQCCHCASDWIHLYYNSMEMP